MGKLLLTFEEKNPFWVKAPKSPEIVLSGGRKASFLSLTPWNNCLLTFLKAFFAKEVLFHILPSVLLSFFFPSNLCMYVFLFGCAGSWLSLVAVSGLLLAVASLVPEHSL